jgi:hypothetical protein
MGVNRANKRTLCSATGKMRYESYFEAKFAAAAIREETHEDHGTPYSCSDCGGWHLGRASMPGSTG